MLRIPGGFIIKAIIQNGSFADMKRTAEQIAVVPEKPQPTEEELEYCAYVQNILKNAGCDTSQIRYNRQKNGWIYMKCPYWFAVIKVEKRSAVLFFRVRDFTECGLKTSYYNTGKGENSPVKVKIMHPRQIDELSVSLVTAFRNAEKKMQRYLERKDIADRDAEKTFCIPEEDADRLAAACIARADARAEEKARKATEKAARKASDGGWDNEPRRVGRYDDNMKLLRVYYSVKEAARAVGSTPKSIRDSATGRHIHAAGYIWRYMVERFD